MKFTALRVHFQSETGVRISNRGIQWFEESVGGTFQHTTLIAALYVFKDLDGLVETIKFIISLLS